MSSPFLKDGVEKGGFHWQGEFSRVAAAVAGVGVLGVSSSSLSLEEPSFSLSWGGEGGLSGKFSSSPSFPLSPLFPSSPSLSCGGGGVFGVIRNCQADVKFRRAEKDFRKMSSNRQKVFL